MHKEPVFIVVLLFVFGIQAIAQEPVGKITDTNTPLHAMKPDYPVPYGPAAAEEIKEDSAVMFYKLGTDWRNYRY